LDEIGQENQPVVVKASATVGKPTKQKKSKKNPEGLQK
jgi:hypothetical protein